VLWINTVNTADSDVTAFPDAMLEGEHWPNLKNADREKTRSRSAFRPGNRA